MKLPRWVGTILLSLAALVAAIALAIGSLWLYLHPKTERANGIEYGQRRGHKLVLDVIKPAKPNGRGVAVMVSGGWKSSGAGSFGSWITAPLLRHGYTLFPVYHVSQPE